ncbi:MAG TPA: sugar transferase [Alphaproteobacteria bacterium]
MGAIFQTFDEQISRAAATLDGLLITTVAALAWSLGAGTSLLIIDSHTATLLVCIQLVCLGLLYLMGAYASRRYHWPTVVGRLVSLYGGAILLSAGSWAAPAFWTYVGFTCAISVTGGAALHWLFLGRSIARDSLSGRSRVSARPVLVVAGDDAVIDRWIADLEGRLGTFFYIARAQLPRPLPSGDASPRDLVVREHVEALLQFAKRHNAACVIMAPAAGDAWLRVIASELKLRGCDVASADAFLQRQMRAIEPSDGYEAHWAFHCSLKRSVMWLLTKRVVDLAIAASLFLLAAPMLVAIAVAVKLSSPGPILYRQTRVGLNGRPFVIYKFRSMRIDAEVSQAPQWASQRDPRATRVGHWLRHFHLDELPQLFNILRGDMSFVGPRPERPEFVEILTARVPCYRIRHAVKPGLTGWAQINYPYGASIEDAKRKLAFDLFYVERAGVLLDLFVVMRTARVVLLGEGAR